MRIAIIGTRGIPNYHGGFEQFSEYFSVYLVEQGHEVYVYNSSSHPYKKPKFKGVNIISCKDPEDRIGTAGQFIYDLNCILDSRKRKYDIILQLGYTSNSIWHWLLPKNSKIVTNMDGLEWKRSKYKKPVQKFLRFAEKLGVKSSDYLIADSVGIQIYLREEYNVESKYIAYGANVFQNSNENILQKYKVEKNKYNLLIARLEPENNIETILDGVNASANNKRGPFLVIGKHETEFGEYLKKKFRNNTMILFLGGIYNQDDLNNLRFFSNLYFHGHSVGGTNPSLLEAMASNALIIANNNIFNKSILGKDAYYFNCSKDISDLLLSVDKKNNIEILKNNEHKIMNTFNWELINGEYEKYLLECLQE
jgi:hypothetical protein